MTIIREQLPAVRALAFPVWAALGAVLAAAVYARARFGIPWNDMIGDPAAALGAPFYLGFVSNVGILAWAATSAIFLFSALVHRDGDGGWRRYLLCSGLFAGWLGLDDLFLVHERILPDYLGVSEPVSASLYAAAGLAYVSAFAPCIRRSAWLLLGTAFALLATSLAFDRFVADLLAQTFWEDAAKLMGIGAWLAYAIHTSAAALKGELAPLPAPILGRRAFWRRSFT